MMNFNKRCGQKINRSKKKKPHMQMLIFIYKNSTIKEKIKKKGEIKKKREK